MFSWLCISICKSTNMLKSSFNFRNITTSKQRMATSKHFRFPNAKYIQERKAAGFEIKSIIMLQKEKYLRYFFIFWLIDFGMT